MNKTGDFKIEHGIPLTERVAKTGLSQALRDMKVDDSVLLPEGMSGGSAISCARALGMRVAVRTMPDKRVRIWKVKVK